MKSRSTARLAPPLLALLSSISCGGGSSPPPAPPALPDVRYAYSTDPDAQLPEGATLIGEAEFARRYAAGRLALDGPEARLEMQAREEDQDEADLATIQEYQAANPGAEPMLPELVDVRDGSVEPAAGGNLKLLVGSNRFTTLGERFRLRTVAGAIRGFNTKENQLAIYGELLEGLPPEVIEELSLPPYEEASILEVAELKDMNFSIAALWQDIVAFVPTVALAPLLPPSCSGDMGDGGGGDRFVPAGDPTNCVFSGSGIMLNHDWQGKEHISCVKNQAVRGACPAFSSVSTMEHRIHAKFGLRTNLSEQALYARMKLVWGKGEHFPDGYWPAAAFNSSFAEGYLVPFENQWNYNPSPFRVEGTSSYTNSCLWYTEACSDAAHQTYHVCTKSGSGTYCAYEFPDVNLGNYGFRVSSGTTNFWDPANRDVSVMLMTTYVSLFRQPVIWSFDVEASSFDPDSNGYVTFSSASENFRKGGHAVHVVGVIANTQLAEALPDAPPGTGGGYFIIKNSWGGCWGDAGFAYIPLSSVRHYTLELALAPGVL